MHQSMIQLSGGDFCPVTLVLPHPALVIADMTSAAAAVEKFLAENPVDEAVLEEDTEQYNIWYRYMHGNDRLWKIRCNGESFEVV